MTNDIQYINIKEILSRLLRNKKLLDLTLEAVAQYTIDFIGVFGLPDMYENKEVLVSIESFRGLLPCDLIAVNQVMDTCTNSCLRSMTDTFMPDGRNTGRHSIGRSSYADELTYKTKNRVIFTSFEKGKVKVNYKAIPVDDDGFPLIIDNSPYLRALESFIKMEVFTNMFDNDEISIKVLQNAKQDYAWRAGLLQSEFNLPSEAEMENACRMWTTLIQRTHDFDDGWKHLGDREYILKH